MGKTEFQIQKEIRDAYIVEQFRKLQGEDADKVATIASAIKLTTQRVREILLAAGLLTRRRHDEQRKIKSEVLNALHSADIHLRAKMVDQLAAQHSYPATTIRQWCATAGIKLNVKESSTKLAMRIVGAYLRTRRVSQAAAECGVSREHATKTLADAETCGLLGLAKGALKNDPEVAEALREIDRQNKIIADRLVKLAGGKK